MVVAVTSDINRHCRNGSPGQREPFLEAEKARWGILDEPQLKVLEGQGLSRAPPSGWFRVCSHRVKEKGLRKLFTGE